MNDFKAAGTKPNPYRNKVVDYACMKAFGDNPTKEGVFRRHGALVARMFARGAEGRADTARPLRLEAQEVVEAMGPKLTTEARKARVRAVSVVGRRGQEQAASAAGPRHRPTSPKSNTLSP